MVACFNKNFDFLQKSSKLGAFKWSDCGSTAANLTTLSILPDPLQFPGTLNLTVAVDITNSASFKDKPKVNKCYPFCTKGSEARLRCYFFVNIHIEKLY